MLETNETIETLLSRRSIRRYLNEPLDQDILRAIVDVGLRAPTAGGCQATTLVVCRDRETNELLGRISNDLYDEGAYPVSVAQPSTACERGPRNAFYGAPVVVRILTPKCWDYAAADAAICAYAMMVAAKSLGVGSCYISRAKRTLATPEGLAFLERAGVPKDYEGACHVLLGYPESWDADEHGLYPDREFWC